MPRITIVVAATSPDIIAAGIAAGVAASADMALAQGRVVTVGEVNALLEAASPSGPCALVLVGPQTETANLAERWLAAWPGLVAVCVGSPIGDIVRITLKNIGLSELLAELRSLVDHGGTVPRERVAHVQLRPVSPIGAQDTAPSSGRTALDAAVNWIHVVLRGAVPKLAPGNGDLPGLTVSTATAADFLDDKTARTASHVFDGIQAADAELSRAMAAAHTQAEPIVRAARVFGLSAIEFRLLLLALAPELDLRYQRCMGLLLDDMSRRVGTIGLYTALMGEPSQVRRELAQTGNLIRWRIFDGHPGCLPPADEPLRLDPYLVEWLFGNDSSLRHDRHARRAMRLASWPGASLLEERQEHAYATNLIDRLQGAGDGQWLLLGGDDPAGWRALLELGAETRQMRLIRVETARLAGLEIADDVEECGLRLGRMARLTESALVVDAAGLDPSSRAGDLTSVFLDAVTSTNVRAAVIADNEAQIVRLLGSARFEAERTALDRAARIAAVRTAANRADAYLTEETANSVMNQYSLRIDGLEQAMRLARGKPMTYDTDDPRATRFIAACKEVAAEGISSLADRIDPIFGIDDVVLPPDRKEQLIEIVDSIRLAPKVLDEWKFREQLPYGRGVTALFHGPSGTGKTMAAMGVARKLGVQILRLDLSRVVSKYIGDTEKNIDRVFVDAQRSGSAILIDEADALFGKRSEVKDAHDRYANIEVAFLLQRMEAYEGLAILTTNLRQNLDAAFLRRLRFIVDFCRPDAEAREKIWRRCLPEASHALDDAAFRLLARRVDLTGGHIRQITLRAAFIAAASDTPINLEHISHACRAEFAKLGMPPMEIEPADRKRAA